MEHWSKRGFARRTYFDLTMSINSEIGNVKRAGLLPTLVRLGLFASRVYIKEHWGEAPEAHGGIPIRYNDSSISGVIVEGKPP